jgi:hypothetical protein
MRAVADQKGDGMAKTRLVWVDVGMVVMAAAFAAMVYFTLGTDQFVPVALVYVLALVVWALVAEVAAVRSEQLHGDGEDRAPAPSQ